MEANQYQTLAKQTAGKHDLAYFALGLVGEAGEVAEHVKKAVYHGHEHDIEAITKELGDVMWYLSMLADHYGIPLAAVMERNIAKLADRYPAGFSQEASRNRKEYVHIDTSDTGVPTVSEPGAGSSRCC